MKTVAALSILLLSQASAPDFTFREHNASGRYNLNALSELDCDVSQEGRMWRCTQLTTLAGSSATAMSITIFDQKLYILSFLGPRTAINTLIPSLRERYGMPCRAEEETIYNGLGNALKSQKFVWCFSTGELTFHERYGRIDQYRLTYVDFHNAPPSKGVKPDF